MTTISTTLRTFSFDTKTPVGLREWEAFKKARKADGAKLMGPVLADHFLAFEKLDGATVELETNFLFDDQWNTAPVAGISEEGVRVFDFTLQSDCAEYAGGRVSARYGIRRGHYLEQTAEMREVRTATLKCGYCGKQEPAVSGLTFCRHCIGSEYLKVEDLHLTRLLPAAASGIGGNRAKLTEAEMSERMPLYLEAQLHGNTERDRQRIAAERAKIERDFQKATTAATAKRDGMVWLMDHGLRTDNVIYYDHTNRFSFGWRRKLSADEVSRLLALISEFPGSYDLQCEDGRTLSGN